MREWVRSRLVRSTVRCPSCGYAIPGGRDGVVLECHLSVCRDNNKGGKEE